MWKRLDLNSGLVSSEPGALHDSMMLLLKRKGGGQCSPHFRIKWGKGVYVTLGIIRTEFKVFLPKASAQVWLAHQQLSITCKLVRNSDSGAPLGPRAWNENQDWAQREAWFWKLPGGLVPSPHNPQLSRWNDVIAVWSGTPGVFPEPPPPQLLELQSSRHACFSRK